MKMTANLILRFASFANLAAAAYSYSRHDWPQFVLCSLLAAMWWELREIRNSD